MGRTLVRNGIHLLALSGFAIAKPLYDFVETDPSSLVVDDVTGGAMVVMALVLLLLPPLLLLAVEAIVARVKEDWLEWVHLAFVGGLVALFVFQARTSIGVLPESFPALAPIALLIGTGAALLYRKAEVLRTYLSVLAIAPVLFLALFLFAGDASPLVTDVGAAGKGRAADTSGAPPVVFVVFDELPLASLIDREGKLDAARFPNFARFAEDATWFRNTTSVEAFTPWAVPALLDAKLPERKAYSHPAFHPDSLFTLLGRTHEMRVREAFTRVCPKRLCPRDEGNFLVRGIRGFDGLVVPFWSRLVPGRPGEYAAKATQKLRGLAGAETQGAAPGDTPQIAEVRDVVNARVPTFESFLGDLEPTERPALYYEHLLFPHAPFDYQREGPYVMHGERLRNDVWDPDPSLTALGLRRHLVQLEYTDRLLGQMLDRLQETGLYDRAAVVLTADHGAAFAPGIDRRVPRPKLLPSLAPVPFLLKAPGQKEGKVDDTPGETIDVLPTLAETIGVELPWKHDGRSLLSGETGGRDEVRMSFQGRPGRRAVPRSAVEFGIPGMQARFPISGDGKDRSHLFAERGFAQLIGKDLPAATGQGKIAFDRTKTPRMALQGTVSGGGKPGRVVAVGRCGKVVSVARTYDAGGKERFAALVDPSIPGDCPPEARIIG